MARMTPSDLLFLKKLAKHNDRDWFQKNKADFENAQANFLGLVTSLIYAMGDYDESIIGIEPKSCIFRIYRDVRFSKNKAPYKNHLGAFICSAGRKSGTHPGYYIHIEPGGQSIFGSGCYMPEKEVLAAFRNDIANPQSRIVKMLADKNFRKNFPDLSDEDKAKTIPRGFDKAHPQAELLKMKHCFVTTNLADNVVTGKKFLDVLTEKGKFLAKWNQLLLGVTKKR